MFLTTRSSSQNETGEVGSSPSYPKAKYKTPNRQGGVYAVGISRLVPLNRLESRHSLVCKPRFFESARDSRNPEKSSDAF